MADIYDRNKRSQIMSNISGKETKPEILIRKSLFSKGFRYRKNVQKMPGQPDIVLSKYKTVIFIHGCFWHGHKKCKAAKLPETRKEFWEEKIKSNIARDKRTTNELKQLGWHVITIWQCDISNKEKQTKRLELLRNQITEN